jgi:exodeoxyribonuclease (lambda-induced)
MSAVLAEQGSADWIYARSGKLTASRFADAVATLKDGNWAKARHDYMIELLAERLTGLAAAHYVSREMLEGIEAEEYAVAAYEFERDVECDPIGFVEHPSIANAGASPDRAVGKVGLLEVKAPKSTTFIELRLDKESGYAYPRKSSDADAGYIAQCMWQLACCPEREWNDLTYYDARMPQGKQLYVRRIMRDDKIIAAMEAEARRFLDELDALEQKFA